LSQAYVERKERRRPPIILAQQVLSQQVRRESDGCPNVRLSVRGPKTKGAAQRSL
jgi:hypothetical protein